MFSLPSSSGCYRHWVLSANQCLFRLSPGKAALPGGVSKTHMLQLCDWKRETGRLSTDMALNLQITTLHSYISSNTWHQHSSVLRTYYYIQIKLLCGCCIAVAEKEAHRERYCGHHIPRRKYSLCTGHDRLQLSPCLRCGPSGEPLL